MHRHLLISISVLALASCSGEPGAPPSADEVAEAAENLVRPSPGLYRSTANLTEFEVPGMSPAQAAQMKEMMGSAASQSTESCLTEKESEEGFKSMAKKLGEGQQGVKCEFSKFVADGSTLDADLTCTGEGGVNVAMEMDGDIEATKSLITMKMSQKNAEIPGGEVRIAMEVKSERIGDCK